jgi:di/tricarboxylate transporter
MLLALAMFVSDRIRPDAVALIVLLLGWITGLVTFEEALAGFGSPAVIIVAAVLVLGRAVELTGAAQAMTSWLVPNVRFFSVRIAGVLLMGMLLSAFMNNIAALAITMPVAMTIAREHKVPPGAVLMPLAFATLLGGITTLVGTPANLIISSVREDRLGEGFGMFSMTPAAGAVALLGLVYLVLIGWRLAPKRKGPEQDLPRQRVFVFELTLPIGAIRSRISVADARRSLRQAGASLLSVIRNGERTRLDAETSLRPADQLLVMSREPPWRIAPKAGFFTPLESDHSGVITAHVTIIYGSSLIGHPYAEISGRTDGEVEFVAAGPRAARLRCPLGKNLMQSGDQLYLRGTPEALARLIRSARLLEVDRQAGPVLPGRSALYVIGIYALAVLASSLFDIPTTASFLAGALAVCLLRLIPADEAYRSIDLPVIVLLAAMIPLGREFNNAGGSDAIASGLSMALNGAPLFLSLLVLGVVTLILTVFLNNVATSIVMAQVGIEFASALAVPPDAALIMVLICCSCDFLTPIGHQNNMLVMRPGGYRFMDYPKVGAPLSAIVVVGSAWILSAMYG